jgi:hypothetical protein
MTGLDPAMTMHLQRAPDAIGRGAGLLRRNAGRNDNSEWWILKFI